MVRSPRCIYPSSHFLMQRWVHYKRHNIYLVLEYIPHTLKFAAFTCDDPYQSGNLCNFPIIFYWRPLAYLSTSPNHWCVMFLPSVMLYPVCCTHSLSRVVGWSTFPTSTENWAASISRRASCSPVILPSAVAMPSTSWRPGALPQRTLSSSQVGLSKQLGDVALRGI